MSMHPSPDDTPADTPMLPAASSSVKMPPASYRDMGDASYRPLHLPSPLPSTTRSKRMKSDYAALRPEFVFDEDFDKDKVPYVIDQNADNTETKTGKDNLNTHLERKGTKRKVASCLRNPYQGSRIVWSRETSCSRSWIGAACTID